MHQDMDPPPHGGETQQNSNPFQDARLSIPRVRLPDTRRSVTHKFTVCGTEGYLMVGLYEDGRPGELFLKIAKEGSTLNGLFNTIGILTSLGLQHGVPLSAMARKLAHMQFEPAGFTKNPDLPEATSLVDYIFRWLALHFPDRGVADDCES